MGDEFMVQRNTKYVKVKAARGKGWRGLVKKKNGDTRICCTPTRFKKNVDEYFRIVSISQCDCLEGLNPFVSSEYACLYRAC